MRAMVPLRDASVHSGGETLRGLRGRRGRSSSNKRLHQFHRNRRDREASRETEKEQWEGIRAGYLWRQRYRVGDGALQLLCLQ